MRGGTCIEEVCFCSLTLNPLMEFALNQQYTTPMTNKMSLLLKLSPRCLPLVTLLLYSVPLMNKYYLSRALLTAATARR